MKHIFPIRALKDNYIWTFYDSYLKHAWVVDPGDAKPVIEFLKNQGLTLTGILITHHHADHTAGIRDLVAYAGNIPVYGNQKNPLLGINHYVKNGDEISCSDLKLTVMEIPGHTLDHTAFYNDKMLFCGDTLFSAGCGKIFEGTPAQMYESLHKLMHLPAQTQIYCGHEYTLRNLQFAEQVEPNNEEIKEKLKKVSLLIKQNECTLPSTIEEEKKINPFLRCYVPEVIKSVEKHAKKILKDPIEVFTYLRQWKNQF